MEWNHRWNGSIGMTRRDTDRNGSPSGMEQSGMALMMQVECQQA